MTLRAADLRFVLPRHPATAVVLGTGTDPGLAAVLAGLRAAGVTVAEAPVPGEASPDLVVAASRAAPSALRVPAGAHLLLGRSPARRPTGARPLLVRGGLTRPTTVLPLAPPSPVRHYLDAVARPPSAPARARNRLLSAAVRLPLRRLVPPGAALVLRDPGSGDTPRLIAAAGTELRLPVGPAGWLLALGRGDDLQRAVFHVFDDGPAPVWVLKFARVPGNDAPFVRDERGLGLIAAVGGAVAEHAPVHLGRLWVDGLPASAETAAPGRPLLEQLAGGSTLLVDAVAEWVIRLAERSALPADALAPERDRLARDVLPQWLAAGAPADLVERLPPLAAVVQHNDLGSWNVLVDGDRFTAVDWESAQAAGLPLWDLLYLLGDVLPRLDGPAEPTALLHRAIALFAGRSTRSPVLFGWIRAAVARLQIPPGAVGPIATLCWLHHGLSAGARQAALSDTAPAGSVAAPVGHLALLATRWLRDPALGPDWSAWRR